MSTSGWVVLVLGDGVVEESSQPVWPTVFSDHTLRVTVSADARAGEPPTQSERQRRQARIGQSASALLLNVISSSLVPRLLAARGRSRTFRCQPFWRLLARRETFRFLTSRRPNAATGCDGLSGRKSAIRGPKRFAGRAEWRISAMCAKHAGVAIATVSAALNESDSGQRRNPQARLGGSRGRRLFAERHRPQPSPRQEPADRHRHLRYLQSVLRRRWCARWRERAIAAGYSIIVCNTDDDAERERAVLDQLRAQHVAGIILTPVGRGSRLCQAPRVAQPAADRHRRPQGAGPCARFRRRRQPRRGAHAYRIPPPPRASADRDDHRHARACGPPTSGSPPLSKRWRRPALWSIRRSAYPATIAATLAYEATKPLMTRADRPTAIIGANNVMALGALQAILDLGFRCPGRRVSRRHRRRALERPCQAARCHLRPADRGDRAGSRDLPARTHVRKSQTHMRRRATSSSSRTSSPGNSCAALRPLEVAALA